MESIALRGTLEIGGGVCVSSCSSGDRSTYSLALRCATGQQYQSAVATAEPIRISTPGAAGASFVDLPLLEQLLAVEMLYVRSDQPIVMRIAADEPIIVGSGGVFPTLFAGGETLVLDVDGSPLTVTFLAGDQTAAQCVARINSAFALAGYPTPRASVLTSGQIQIEGIGTGAQSSLEVTAGTGAAQLGLVGASAIGEGADVPVWGTFLCEFGVSGSQPAVPARIQFSGVANITVVAAGRTTL